MGNLISWVRPRGAVHDLMHLLSLGDDHCILLCLSEQELYVLQNWLALDLEFESRYAIQLLEGGYYPLYKDHPLWTSWLAFVRGFQVGARDMTCNIENGLNSIADALSLMAQRPCGYCGGGVAPTSLVPCLSGYTNDVLIGPGEYEVIEGQPPEGFETWEEYLAYKCDAAYLVWLIQRRHMVALRNFDGAILAADIVAPIIAALAGALPAAFTPAGFVVFVGTIIAIGVAAGWAWHYMDDMIAYWDANQQDIICSLYNAGTSVAAVEGLANFLEDAIQSIVFSGILEPLGPVISGLLGEAFGQLQGNGIVEPLFRAMASVLATDFDCAPCGAQAGDCSENNTLVYGTGTLNVPGISTIAPQFVSDWYRIDLQLKRGLCIRITGGPSGQIYKLYRCQNGAYSAEYATFGAPTNTWSCAGRFTLQSDVATAVTFVLGDDDCGDDDLLCP